MEARLMTRARIPELRPVALALLAAIAAACGPTTADAPLDGPPVPPPGDGGALADGAARDVPAGDAAEGDGGYGDGGCPPPPSDVPYAGRTENAEFTDPADCPDCPGPFTGVEELDAPVAPNATALTVTGSSAGASSCEWYVIGGACGVVSGQTAMDPDGSAFSTTFPLFCGTNIVQIVCHDGAGARVIVRRLEGTQCSGRDLRLTLSWDDQGTDMELHLVRDGAHINSVTDDCTWFTCINEDLAWGPLPENYPRKDVDNVSYFGPENIYLDKAPDGRYHVLVEYWGSGQPSRNVVDVTIREATVAHRVWPDLGAKFVWYVGMVDFPAGVFTVVDQISDCNAAWGPVPVELVLGCNLPLP
ncbi:MAG: hypothetical protein HY906_17180 [Deltaproteobacteria bacterium]|nr:hypothetical protein [Deltaproteobacteria bacterium]